MLIILSDFLMVEQIFILPQVKRGMIISTKLVYMIYLASWQTTKALLGNIRKIFELHRIIPSAQSSSRNNHFVSASKSLQRLYFSRSALFRMKTRVCLKYFVNDCSNQKHIHSKGLEIMQLFIKIYFMNSIPTTIPTTIQSDGCRYANTTELSKFSWSSVMRCVIWYHLQNSKNMKNTHGGVLLLITKSNIPPWVFFTFFKL